jgi:hypothetical protein
MAIEDRIEWKLDAIAIQLKAIQTALTDIAARC